ncbi:hypothetical protein FRC20_000819 [Serendipita sp. 405]|nr:hypothetical protein FRC20_000819 [Serendipita sp. 405]
MAQLTRIPDRHRAELAEILIQDRTSGEESPSVAELMFQLRLKFAKEDEEISSKILYYEDPMFGDSVDGRSDPNGSRDAVHEKKECKQLRAQVQPPPPPRPDSSTLAKLLEVSSTEWSDLSDLDTTADSKLAVWLASFAKSNTNVDCPIQNTLALHLASSPDQSGSIVDESLNDSFALHLSEVAPPGHTPWKPRHSRLDIPYLYSKRPRALSDPGTPCPKLPFLTVRDSEDSTIDNSVIRSSGDSNQSYYSAPSSQLRFFPPFDFEVHPQPSVMTQLDPELLCPSLVTPNTPTTPELETPKTSDGFDSLVPLSPQKTVFQEIVRTVRFQGVNEPRSIHVPEASFAGSSLYDISDTYAFNRALRHASKSPHLIRNWRRVVEELGNRFALDFGTIASDQPIHFSFGASEGSQDSMIGGSDGIIPFSSSTPTRPANLEKDAGLSSQIMEQQQHSPTILNDTSTGFQSDSSGSRRGKRTAADTLLDWEYSAHLRKSIERKEVEIKALAQLIIQRDTTIGRLKNALKKKEFDVSPNED